MADNISFDFNGVSTATVEKVFEEGKIGDKAISKITGAVFDGTTITIPGYGKIEAATTTTMKITLSSAAPAGTYDITGKGAIAVVTEVDASAMTNAFTLGKLTANALGTITTGSGADVVKADNTLLRVTTKAGDDSIELAGTGTYVVNAGAGSDTVKTSAIIGTGTTIDLGASDGNADTFEIGDIANVPTNTVTVNSYNYTDGDVVKLVGSSADMTLSKDGTAAIAGANALKINATMTDNAYKVKYNNNGTDVEYWTAANNVSSVNFDASSMTNVVVADMSGADTASIALGYGKDTVTLANGATTVKVSKASGEDTFKSALGSDDTLILTDGSLDDLVFDNQAIKYAGEGGATLTSAIADEDTGKLKVSTDDGKTSQMVAYTTAGNNNLTASTDVDVYMGFGDGTTTSITSASDVNLYDTAKYKNISKEISVTGSGVFIGAKDATTAIDASAATDAVQIWGGSTAANDIKLNKTGKKSDTVWFGTTDGVDTVTDFVGGYGTDGDVLYLYDTADLSKVTFDHNVGDGLVKTGKSTASIASAASDQINIKLSDGTVKKVAADLTGVDNKIYAEYADVVIGDAKVDKTVVYGETQTDAVLVNLYDTGKYQNIINIDTSVAKAGAVAIGAEGKKSNITLGAGTNAVWGGSTDTNTITLTADKGKDTVWFGAIDGKDTVANFNIASDTIKLWDAASTKEIFKNYSVTQASAGTNFTVTSSTAKDTTLDVTAAVVAGASNTVKFQDASDKVVKAVVSDTVNNLTFATDASLYYCGEAATVQAGNSVTGTITAFLDNGGWADAGDYYFGSTINAFDASKSAAKTVLIGRADQEGKLYGGLTENAIWGGGYASQDMQGSVAAVDTIWFGTTDGADTFSKGVDKGDTIYLWDVTSIDNVKLTMGGATGAETETLVLGGSTLTISDKDYTARDGGLTFKLSTGASYTYDKANSKFVAKA